MQLPPSDFHTVFPSSLVEKSNFFRKGVPHITRQNTEQQQQHLFTEQTQLLSTHKVALGNTFLNSKQFQHLPFVYCNVCTFLYSAQ